MSGTVRIQPSGHEFTVSPGETILESALRAGLALDYGCANGTCGECRARVVAGDVRDIRFHDYSLTESEKRAGVALLCSVTAAGVVVVEASLAGGAADIPHQQVRARVYEIERLSEDLMVLHAKVLRGKVLRFLAGQFVNLRLDVRTAQDVSVASCPCDGLNLRFHLRHRPGERFSEKLFHATGKNDKIQIEGPSGEFTLDETSSRPILFYAYDAGFAPIESLVEHAINRELAQPMYLYRCAPPQRDHYLHNYCRSLADALEAFTYRPLESDEAPDPAAAARRVAGELGDLGGFDAYVSGPAPFADAARAAFTEHGLPPERLFVNALERRTPMWRGRMTVE